MGSKIQRVKRLRFAADSLLFSLLVLLIFIFIKAYINNYQLKITINQYGEAKVELILLLGLILPLASLAVVYSYLDLISTWKTKEWVATTDYNMLGDWRRGLSGKTLTLKCTNCGKSFPFDPLSSPNRYVTISCPFCGHTGTVDILALSEGSRRDDDIKVRVIKDIWDGRG